MVPTVSESAVRGSYVMDPQQEVQAVQELLGILQGLAGCMDYLSRIGDSHDHWLSNSVRSLDSVDGLDRHVATITGVKPTHTRVEGNMEDRYTGGALEVTLTVGYGKNNPQIHLGTLETQDLMLTRGNLEYVDSLVGQRIHVYSQQGQMVGIGARSIQSFKL